MGRVLPQDLPVRGDRLPNVPSLLGPCLELAVGVLQDRRATPVLLEMLRGRSSKLRKAAAQSLIGMADPQSLQVLFDHVRAAPDGGVELYSATCAIGAIEGPKALAALRQLASHPSFLVREAVAYRMGERATAEDLPLLIGLISNPRPGNHFPTKALVRLLPASVGPLVRLLPNTKPEMKVRIAAVLVKHDSGRPAVREMLTSSIKMVRSSARRLLWEQRDPAVTIEQMIASNQGVFADERDLPAYRRLAKSGNEMERVRALTYLIRHEPQTAWPEVRPLLCQDERGPGMQAVNIIGSNFPDWVEQEIIRTLESPEGLSCHGKAKLLAMLRKKNCIKPRAVALYRRYADDADFYIRSEAYRCLWSEASDESMSLLASKALEGDSPAQWAIGGGPDKRLAATFSRLVAEATEKKETWVGGYVHSWPTASGVAQYVAKVGSNYAEQWEVARRTILETKPD